MSYLIGSGYVPSPENEKFLEIWADNFTKHPVPDGCSRIVIAGVGGGPRPIVSVGHKVEWVGLQGNCGHVGDLIHGKKHHEICGWTAAVCALAMLAYCDESDFIYKEQDCLCFGPWVEQLYADMGDGSMAFGGPMKSEPFMECAQSLFIVRHSFIPQFVASVLWMGDERRQGSDGKEDNLPERKFKRVRDNNFPEVRELSFGVDRERPLPYNSPVFYAQKFTQEELAELKIRGMV